MLELCECESKYAIQWCQLEPSVVYIDHAEFTFSEATQVGQRILECKCIEPGHKFKTRLT